VTALQVLPARQLAVLILRDVLGFHASEVAGMLDSTVESVNSALKRARASLQRQQPPAAGREPSPVCGSPAEDALVAKFVRAWESADLGALVALLTDDVFMSMPPMPFEYQGRHVVARFCAGLFGAGRRFDLVPTRANGQPAFGAYLRAPGGISHGTGLYVLTLSGDRICAMTRFENSVLPWFGLPRSLPSPHRTRDGGTRPPRLAPVTRSGPAPRVPRPPDARRAPARRADVDRVRAPGGHSAAITARPASSGAGRGPVSSLLSVEGGNVRPREARAGRGQRHHEQPAQVPVTTAPGTALGRPVC
jgi:hypothetical protein